MPYDPQGDADAAWQKFWNQTGVDPNPEERDKPDLSVGKTLPRFDSVEVEAR